MNMKKLILSTICLCLVLSVVTYEVCTQLSITNQLTYNDDSSSGATDTVDQNQSDDTTNTDDETPFPTTSTSTDASSSGSGSSITTGTVTSQNKASHEDSADYVWNISEVVDILLNGNFITSNSTNVTIDGSTATITSAGIYKITGSLANGQIIVDSQSKETICLILNGVGITCSNSAPLYILNAEKIILILQDNTQNYLTETASYTTITGDEANAAIFSKSDLTIYGSGSLTIDSAYNDGVTSKDGLIIKSGTIMVNSHDDGIRGKDYLIIKGGKTIVNAGENGLISDDTSDSTKGYISIEGGVIDIVSTGDAIDAETDVTISDGQLTTTSGGGSDGRVYSDTSAKGIKGAVSVVIDGGTITLNSADDAIHSNGTVTINGGTFSISTGDDGVHADSTIIISNGAIDIKKSYEGIEAQVITINGGTIYITASDDGINGAGGNDASGFQPGPGRPGGGGGQDMFMNSGDCSFTVNGGYIVVSASGDGVDINGAVVMTSGTLIVTGPTDNANGALDFSTFKMTGGYLIAVGSSGMAQSLSTTSTQCSVIVNFRTAYSGGQIINIQTSSGTNVLTFKATKHFQSIVFCSPSLIYGTTYDVYVGGSSTGTLKDGVYSNGVYTQGEKYTSFTISSVVTKSTYF